MNILHFYKTSIYESFGGVEKFIDELTLNTKNYGVNNTIIALTPKNINSFKEYNGVKVYFCKTNIDYASTPMSISAFKIFKEVIKDIDLIHYHFPYPFSDIINLVSANNKKYIITYHSDIVKQKKLLLIYKPLMKNFLDGAEKIVATSQNYLESSSVLRKYRSKVDIIPCGLTNDLIYFNKDKASEKIIKRKYGEKYFFFVGRLVYYKGIDFLIDAAKLNNYSLVIAGKGNYFKDINKEIKKHNLKHVHLIGEISKNEKYNLMSNCYSFIFPSNQRSEAFGLSLLEASMFSKPLISCEIGTGTTFINKNNETGLVIKPNDSTAINSSMKYLWDNESISKKFGENSYKRYEELFTAKKMSESYIRLYKSIINI